jgi:hypothetical protein
MHLAAGRHRDSHSTDNSRTRIRNEQRAHRVDCLYVTFAGIPRGTAPIFAILTAELGEPL